MKEILDIMMSVGMVAFLIFIVNGYFKTKFDKE